MFFFILWPFHLNNSWVTHCFSTLNVSRWSEFCSLATKFIHYRCLNPTRLIWQKKCGRAICRSHQDDIRARHGNGCGQKAPTSSMEGQFFTKEKEPKDILFLNTFICFVFPWEYNAVWNNTMLLYWSRAVYTRVGRADSSDKEDLLRIEWLHHWHLSRPLMN